jgi:hypothetical protein
VIVCLELFIFGIWTYNILSPENISVNEKMGHVLCTFVIGFFINLAWLYFIEDRFFFNKYAILNKIYTKKITTKKSIADLEENLEKISKNGKPILTPEAIDIWETLPMYCSHTFDERIDLLNKDLNELYDRLSYLEQKESFFLKIYRKNLWMYFKSKIALATT